MRVFGILGLTAAICLVTTVCWVAPAAYAQGACGELVQNGGFENGATWVLGTAPQMPEYVTYAKHSGNRSLVLGITKGASQKSYSSARQTVTIPPTANTVTLSFWFNAMMVDPIKGQYMELVLLTPSGAVLEKPWRSQNDSRIWNQFSFDLSRWHGRTIQLYFNVYNDGQGGTAGMFLDDVSLVACSNGTTTPTVAATPATPTPTRTPSITPSPTGAPVWTATWTPYYVTPTAGPVVATPTPTPYYVTPTPGPIVATATRSPTPQTPLPTIQPWPVTPWPSNCSDVLRNGAFDYGWSGWNPAADALPVQLVATPAYSPPYALQLGTQAQNIKSFSSVRQYVTIPAGTRATLQFWAYTWAEPNAGADRQEAILLASNNAVLAVLWRVQTNEPAWRQVALDLSPYAGRSVAIYFNTYNDGAGGRTAMFLDNVQLLACGVSGPPPGPITVLPPMTIGTPQSVPELTEAALAVGLPRAAAADPGAALNLTPVMTRIGLALTAAPPPTARATATPTLVPLLTATPSATLLRKAADSITALGSPLACILMLVIVGVIVYLLIRYVLPDYLNARYPR